MLGSSKPVHPGREGSVEKGVMEPPLVTTWEKQLLELWKIVLLDGAPPKEREKAGEGGRLISFSPDGLGHLKIALGEGLVWWLSQGTSPPFVNLAGEAATIGPALKFSQTPLSFSQRSVQVLCSLVEPADGGGVLSATDTAPPGGIPTTGDLLIETIVGSWLRDWQPARFASIASNLDPSAVALIALLAFEPLRFEMDRIVWDENALLCLAPRLTLAWESRWRRFHERFGLARSPGQIEDLGRLTQLLVSYWNFARDKNRLDSLSARLVRQCAATLTTMNFSNQPEAFSPEIDWQTMTVVDRQALKRNSHLAFALGDLMEHQSRQARKTSYLSDDYERAQEVLKMYAGVAHIDWVFALNALKRQWSGDIGVAATQPVLPTTATS